MADVKTGFKRLARLGVDVIAPQDGRGTGKAALYWPYEAGSKVTAVDPNLATYGNVGDTTFGERFNASTRELFAAVGAARDELKAEEGIQVALWANVEAFELFGDDNCGLGAPIDRTDKWRIDRALTFDTAPVE